MSRYRESPNGAADDSPGQRPGLMAVRWQSPERATESTVVWPPLQGSMIHRSTFPRALPWAMFGRPVGARERTIYGALERTIQRRLRISKDQRSGVSP